MLLRHAKSSWDDPGLSDHERPLNKRGKQNAITMGKYLKRKRLVPDLIISSTAKRANKTASIIAKNSGYEKKTVESEMLYSAIPENYKKVINDIPDKNNKVLLVGHNPILEDVIARILGESHIMKTCSLAHIELSLDSWKKFSYNTKSKLIDLIVARELEEGIIDE
ncbi:MAG: histidine phosphatase family protein [Nitrososphaeraceae archaeon]|nr:histidine phosphatase family protein [Nitrososphaeraceae archaeon]